MKEWEASAIPLQPTRTRKATKVTALWRNRMKTGIATMLMSHPTKRKSTTTLPRKVQTMGTLLHLLRKKQMGTTTLTYSMTIWTAAIFCRLAMTMPETSRAVAIVTLPMKMTRASGPVTLPGLS
ncbi:unnamed protein product, partial [Cylicostephanus goldi]